jgi:hypothetical protein
MRLTDGDLTEPWGSRRAMTQPRIVIYSSGEAVRPDAGPEKPASSGAVRYLKTGQRRPP